MMILCAEDTEINPIVSGYRRPIPILFGILWASLLVCGPTLAAQQKINWNKLDRYARNVTYSGQSIDELAHQVTQPAKNDLERARLLFIWTSAHLQYDATGPTTEATWEARQPITIISRGKGVCWDFATVFQTLCQHSAIPCHRISGYARTDWSAPAPEQPNHAWNVFRIGDSWYLADPTWQSGTNEGTDVFEQITGYTYFCTPPEAFVLSHLPEHPMYQLMTCPVSLEEFRQVPDIDFLKTREICDPPYVYRDTIQKMSALTASERALQMQSGIYRYAPSTINRKYLNQAIVDKGIEWQNEGDKWFDDGKYTLADSCYAQAIGQFEQIPEPLSTLYDWQVKAIGLTWFNRGMTCLKTGTAGCSQHFQQAWELLKTFRDDPLLRPVISFLSQRNE